MKRGGQKRRAGARCDYGIKGQTCNTTDSEDGGSGSESEKVPAESGKEALMTSSLTS